jgi:hypothetical protein
LLCQIKLYQPSAQQPGQVGRQYRRRPGSPGGLPEGDGGKTDFRALARGESCEGGDHDGGQQSAARAQIQPADFASGLKQANRWYLWNNEFPKPDYSFEDAPIRRLGEVRHRCGILRPYFFSDEDKVDGAPGAWRGGIHEHIHASDMPVVQSDRMHNPRDSNEVFPVNCKVHILGQSCGKRVAGVDVKEHRQPSDDPVVMPAA